MVQKQHQTFTKNPWHAVVETDVCKPQVAKLLMDPNTPAAVWMGASVRKFL